MRQARLEDMAVLVVAAGLSPSDYWSLTWASRGALVRTLNKR